ncbi:MAG: serine hydrolase, partial [Cyclobacteriaceae bacterium]
EKRKAELMNILPNWSESPELFAENFYMDMPLDLRKNEIERIFNEVGPIKSVGELKPLNQLRGSFVIEGEKKRVNVFFTLTPENKPLIQQLTLRLLD